MFPHPHQALICMRLPAEKAITWLGTDQQVLRGDQAKRHSANYVMELKTTLNPVPTLVGITKAATSLQRFTYRQVDSGSSPSNNTGCCVSDLLLNASPTSKSSQNNLPWGRYCCYPLSQIRKCKNWGINEETEAPTQGFWSGSQPLHQNASKVIVLMSKKKKKKEV